MASRHFEALLMAVALSLAHSAVAAPGGGSSSPDVPQPSSSSPAQSKGSDYKKAVVLVKAKQWAAAILFLDKVVAQDPKHADALNYLGYCHRHLGQTGPSLTYYQRALEADPAHKGAHEYLGELYLQMNDLPKAEEMLAKLKALCPGGCEELEDLEGDIAAYKAKAS